MREQYRALVKQNILSQLYGIGRGYATGVIGSFFLSRTCGIGSFISRQSNTIKTDTIWKLSIDCYTPSHRLTLNNLPKASIWDNDDFN